MSHETWVPHARGFNARATLAASVFCDYKRQASTTYTAHGQSGLASALRKVSEVRGDVFCKGIVLNPSDGESYTLAHDKGPLAEDIREKEREL